MGNGRGLPKPAASCTTTVADGMVVKTQLTSPVADKAQQGVDGAAADQPPAGLPDLRQGRRVPAAEPGDVQRPGRLPVPSTSSGRTRSRSRSPRRSCSTGSGACSAPAAPGSPSRSPATRSSTLFERGALEQVGTCTRTSRSSPTSPATRCRSARSARSPARRTGSAPGRSTCCPRRASASTARPAARCAPTGGAARSCAGWPARTPRSTRSGTATRAGWRSQYATQSDRLTEPLVRDERTGELVRAPGPTRWSGRPRRCARPATAAASACCPAAGSPSRTPTRTRSSPGSRSAPTTSTPGPGRTRPRSWTSWPPGWPGSARRPAR